MHYISGGNGIFAIFEQEGSKNTMYYIHKDYLGSYYCVTSDNGIVIEYNSVEQIYSFDPWGRRRNHTDWSYDNVPATFLFDRGFTCHEHLDLFALINMNGRVYDPMLGRFLSPDPIVQGLNNSQNFNRYSYALNNPLKFIDPTGYTHGPPLDFKLGRGDFAPQGYGFHIGPKGTITYGGNGNSDTFANSTSYFNNEGGANNSCGTSFEMEVTDPETGEKFTVLVVIVESTTSENVEEEGGGNSDNPSGGNDQSEGGALDFQTASDAHKIIQIMNGIRDARMSGSEFIDIRQLFFNLPIYTDIAEMISDVKIGNYFMTIHMHLGIYENLKIGIYPARVGQTELFYNTYIKKGFVKEGYWDYIELNGFGGTIPILMIQINTNYDIFYNYLYN